MLSIKLSPQNELRWLGENPSSGTFPAEKGVYPLYHQWRTYHAEAPLIVNTYNTGTGKTKAALLRLLKRAQQRGFHNLRSKDNALLISPTNALLAQHVDDAQAFCQQNELPYRVISLTKEDIDGYPLTGEVQLRPGSKLNGILNDPTAIDNDYSKRASLVVVNPDIFYYAIYYLYNANDKSSLFYQFFHSFNYIIIDEFHYYNPKQLAAFLFVMMYSQERGYIDHSSKMRQFCILTATPRPEVKDYLNNLGLPVEWIQPGDEHIPLEHRALCEPVRALAPVELQVYNRDVLQQDGQTGGLLKLVMERQQDIKKWLATSIGDSPMDGAIISDSLGMINRIHTTLKRVGITEKFMGRITGPENAKSRLEAKEKQLLLTTPTVDIGYNFERDRPKERQSIDFLIIDAYTGDALVQRLGRAARVLAKVPDQQNHTSIVVAIVDATGYEKLKAYDQGTLERAQLAEIAQALPARNDLYAYMRTGAILELHRPLGHIGQGMPDEELPHLYDFLQKVRLCFSHGKVSTSRRWEQDFSFIKKRLKKYDEQGNHYHTLSHVPRESLDRLRPLLEERKKAEELDFTSEYNKKCNGVLYKRIHEIFHDRKEGKRSYDKNDPVKGDNLIRWLRKDTGEYFKEKARFSFRESFQPPEALVHDPEHLHSTLEVSMYSALHFLKYYHVTFYNSKAEWEKATEKRADDQDTTGIALYGKLLRFRETPLRLGLRLDALNSKQDTWEEMHAYQVTTLSGLELVAMDEHNGLVDEARGLFREQAVPMFIYGKDSRTARNLMGLRKQARFQSIPLEIAFSDKGERSYLAVLGTMAFLICDEVPLGYKMQDRRKTQLADDEPYIC